MYKILNQVPICENKKTGSVQVNKRTYYVCEQCGRLSFHKIKSHKHIWCYKHYKQFKNFGHCLDDNPRTNLDKNEIHVIDNVAYIYLYDKNGKHVATGLCDAEDVSKIQYTKWKRSSSGYMMNSPKNGKNIHFSRIILDTDQFVDHINHNTLDNRKENLRIVTKSQNQMNSNYKGVTQTKNDKWYAHIKLHGKMLNLGIYIHREEAMFARWYAETILFKEFRYPKEKPFILPNREKQIKTYVEKKVQRL